MSALDELAARLREEGGLLAAAVREPHGEVRFEPHVEAIREGELLHYGGARLVSEDDPDLALLAGDRLYALGLEELAARGDLEGVIRLAGVIARCAQAHAEGRPEDSTAAWETL